MFQSIHSTSIKHCMH